MTRDARFSDYVKVTRLLAAAGTNANENRNTMILHCAVINLPSGDFFNSKMTEPV